MKIPAFLLSTLLFLFCSCHQTTIQVTKISVVDSSQLADIEEGEDPCVFDTSTYKFTTECLRAYDPRIKFTWDSVDQAATTVLNTTDTMVLHVGGCDFFIYAIKFSTDSSAFRKNDYLLEKSAWLAKHFFKQGFETYFSEGIAKKNYDFDSTGNGLKTLKIINTDTSITNYTYEAITFELEGNRTVISIEGHLD